jgi:hypothetical protein
MVNKNAFGGIGNFPVHSDHFCFDVVGSEVSNGIEFAIKAGEIPFEFAETIVVGKVKYRVFSVAEVDPAEGVAITQKPVK